MTATTVSFFFVAMIPSTLFVLYTKRKALKMQIKSTSNYYLGQASQLVNQINNSHAQQHEKLVSRCMQNVPPAHLHYLIISTHLCNNLM